MFEHSLIDLDTDLERKQQPRRRWLSLPFAVGLHLVALAAFALGSYWNVGPVPVPSLNVAFIDVALPPLPPLPPPSGGGHPRSAAAPRQQPRKPATAPPVEQPTTVPDAPPTPGPATPTTTDLPPGPRTSDPGPSAPGPSTPGPGPSRDPGPGIDDGPSLPIHLTAEMSRPEPLQPIRPLYTEVARRAGLQGTVIVEAVIDEKGRATEIRVLRGLPMGLDRAAVEAIQRCPFKPAMMAGRPVKVYFNLTVNFTIQR
jgi:protein TonB